MGTSAVVFLFMSTQVFLFYGMICSNLWHVARAEIAIKSPSNFICSTLQDTTILFHDFQNKRILFILGVACSVAGAVQQ